MTVVEAFVLVDAGEGRWEIRARSSDRAAGQLWRTRRGYSLVGADQRPLGGFDSIDAALKYLLAPAAVQRRRQTARQHRFPPQL